MYPCRSAASRSPLATGDILRADQGGVVLLPNIRLPAETTVPLVPCGDGAKGTRVYHWAALQITSIEDFDGEGADLLGEDAAAAALPGGRRCVAGSCSAES